MGQSQSRGNEGQVLSKPGETSASVPQQPPYPGPLPEYTFINTLVSLSPNFTFSTSEGTSLMTSNIEAYYPLLAGKYNEGYRLLTFFRMPAVNRQGVFSLSTEVTFQGILCRYPVANEGWRLQVEKSVIQTQFVYQGIISTDTRQVADSSQLTRSICANTQAGGRLLCLEMTGEMMSQGFSGSFAGRSPIMGVDIFYEMPTHPNPEIYVYQLVPVQVQVTMSTFGRSTTVQCDWAGIMNQYLSQGWRLVEIFFDSGQMNPKFMSLTSAVSCIWFFEKPSSAINDFRPRYQGTFIMHNIKVTAGFGGMRAECAWEGQIQEMGRQGWELACVIATPEVHGQGLSTTSIQHILFFQRRII